MRIGKILTPKQIAKQFGITEQTLLSWRSQGMPIVKIGKSILIIEDDFIEWIKNLKNSQKRHNAPQQEISNS